MEKSQEFAFGFRRSHLLIFAVYFSHLMANSASQAAGEGSSYFFYQHPEYPRDCQEILSQCSATTPVTSGVNVIKPNGYTEPFEVFCDNSIGSEGWTVILRRFDGSIDFSRSWAEYKEGFGFPSSEFWLGNEKIAFLTNQKKYELQMTMVNAAGESFFVHYDLFRISDDWGDFKLARFGEYSGNASSVVTYCPANMVFGNCFCQATCNGGCQENCVNGEEACICPNGLFLDEHSNCVSERECSCYAEGLGVIPDGESRVASDCSRNCSCNKYRLNCVNMQCSADATCQEISGDHQCQCNTGFVGDGLICTRPTTVAPPAISDCLDLYNAGNRANGVYTINPSGAPGSEFQVYCDMTTDGGGWTVFQRRQDGTVNFYRNWANYRTGFGSLTGEHWLGNDKLYTLTNSKNYQLRVDLRVSGGSAYYQLYEGFRIDTESNKYRLSYRSNSGTAGNSISSDSYFSTHDRDNDGFSSYNCAQKHRSGWWVYPYCGYGDAYDASCRGRTRNSSNYCYRWPAGSYYHYCTLSNLNGDYTGGNGENIFWAHLPGTTHDCNIPRTEMKIRPI